MRNAPRITLTRQKATGGDADAEGAVRDFGPGFGEVAGVVSVIVGRVGGVDVHLEIGGSVF